MSDGNQRLSLRIYQYRISRQKFSLKVYIIATVFAILTVLQWLPFILRNDFRDFFIKHFYATIILLFLALLLVTLFIFIENLRFIAPTNWMLSLLIVELVTYGLARMLASSTMITFFICLGIVVLVVVIFVLSGILMSHDLTLDVVILFLCSVIFFIGSVFFVMLHIIVELPYSLYIYAGFVIAAVVSFIMYHAQTINGSRYAEMRLNDYWLAGLIIYHDFIILFVVIYYLTCKIVPPHREHEEH